MEPYCGTMTEPGLPVGIQGIQGIHGYTWEYRVYMGIQGLQGIHGIQGIYREYSMESAGVRYLRTSC